MKGYTQDTPTNSAGFSGVFEKARPWLLGICIAVMLLFAMAGTALAQKGKPPKDDGGGGGGNTANSAIAYIGGGALKVMDADGANQTQVLAANRKHAYRYPTWYPDGQRLLFFSDMDGPGLYRINLDGTGLTKVVVLYSMVSGSSSVDVSPFPGVHGQHRIVFRDKSPDGSYSIHVVNEDGTGRTQLTFQAVTEILDPSFTVDTMPTWSPDGRRIAYTHWADAMYEVPGVDGLRLLTLDEDEHGNLTVLEDSLLLPDGDADSFLAGTSMTSFSKTENKIYLSAWDWSGNSDVWALYLDDAGNPVELDQLTYSPEVREGFPTGSADDSKIAYQIERTIYVANSDGSDPVAMPKPAAKGNQSEEAHGQPSFKR
jgi:Tol biopolymer transport system component